MTYLDPASFTHKFVELGGFRYHYVEEGPQGGEPLLLVHGFPDMWYGWRHQIRFLAHRGYRVYAIDSLGYGQTDSPHAIEPYALKNLASHLVAFIDYLQLDKIILLGHDWGGMVVWRTAQYYPTRIKGVLSISTPFSPFNTKYDTLQQIVDKTPEFDYQLKFADEATTAKMDKRPETILGKVAEMGKLSTQELDYYLAQYARSGFRGPLNYYRTTPLNYRDEVQFVQSQGFSGDDAIQASKINTVPCAQIITLRDVILTPAMAKRTASLIKTMQLKEIDADHFALSEKPDEINALIADLLEQFILPNANKAKASL